MSEFEKDLAATLLRLAADEFSNHGCNDYELPNTNEAWALYVAMEDRNGTPAEDRRERPGLDLKTFYVEDWRLMRYLAVQLEEGDHE